MSIYAYNKHNAAWKVLCTVFTYELLNEWDFWYKNNECVNTVRPHFHGVLFIYLLSNSSWVTRLMPIICWLTSCCLSLFYSPQNCSSLFPDHVLIFLRAFHLRLIPKIWRPGTGYYLLSLDAVVITIMTVNTKHSLRDVI